MVTILSNPAFVIFTCITLTTMTYTIAYYWRLAHRDGLESGLKRDMIERGMSPDDIMKVLKATGGNQSED